MDEVNINSKAMLPVGTLLQDGKYRIERYLSSGGFGNTYVATNTEFEEQVAIKEFFMRGISERDGDSVTVSVSNEMNVEQFVSQKEKFRKEARRLRKLRNAHIVDVHDLFEENGTAYYEMDLIKGESLSERMKRTGHPLSESEVLPILDQVLDALDTVHDHGLYHLDLKPANIMVDQTGRALLIDFGASKQMSASEGYSVSTSSALAFTPGYAPLEQMGQNMKSFGPWTDLYALGATLYKLLTGITPPNASEVLMMTSPLMYPCPVSPHLRELIAWMMKSRLDERPQSVSAVRQFLAANPDAEEDETELIGVVEPEPEPESKQEPAPEPHSPTQPGQPVNPLGNKLLWIIGAALVAAVGVWFLLQENPSTVTDLSSGTDTTDATEQVAGRQVTNFEFTSPVKNGIGTYRYTGQVDEQGRPDGEGNAVFSNGDSCSGSFVHGVIEGKPVHYRFKSGDRFEGEMRNDQFYDGRYISADGSYFAGYFHNGQPQSGAWYDKDGKKLADV